MEMKDDWSELWNRKPILKGDVPSITNKLRFRLDFHVHVLFRSFKGFSRKQRIIDFGCGSGAHTIDLARCVACEVIGVDVSNIALRYAVRNQEKHERGIVHFARYDGLRLPFEDECFDGLISIDVFGHVRDLRRTLVELNRVLKPNGRFSFFSESRISAGTPLQFALLKDGIDIDESSRWHVTTLTKEELIRLLLDTGFSMDECYSPYVARFTTHPEWFYQALKNQDRYSTMKAVDTALLRVKRRTERIYSGLFSLYSIAELHTLGRILETGGVYFIGRKTTI